MQLLLPKKMSNGSSPPGDIGTRTKRGLKNNQFPLADSGVLGDVNITIFLFNMQTHPKDFFVAAGTLLLSGKDPCGKER